MVNYLGFHGTSKNSALKIKSQGYKTSKPTEWLGKGVYFFGNHGSINGYEDALWWVKHYNYYKEWVVFQANIKSIKYLDFVSNIKHKNIFERIIKKALNKFIKAGGNILEFEDHMIYKEIDDRNKIEVIRTFVNPTKFVKILSIHSIPRLQVQICVKKNLNKCIKNNIIKDKNCRGV